jgi:hypothetical protein
MQRVHYILFAWPVLVVLLFPLLRKRHAVIAAFVVGLLFLPQVEWSPENIPKPKPLAYPGFEFGKKNVISYAILLALVVYDPKRLFSFRLRWFDLPMLGWSLCPFWSCLSNDVGVAAGFSQTRDQFLEWGAPYFVGRIYINDLESFRDLVIGTLLGALVYVPLCLLETRISPQLHKIIYGFHQHEFLQTVRLGGYRPMVFMKHGLAVSMLMVSGTLIALWLWCTGSLRGLPPLPGKRPIPTGWLVLVLLVSTVLSRSTGALAFGMAGAGVLFLARLWPTRIAMIVLLAAAPLYITDRVTSNVIGESAVEWLQTNFNAERAASYQFRLDNEDLLMDKAFKQPYFGWSGWGRSRVVDSEGRDIAVTDGMWIITLGCWGFVGLVLLYLAMLVPVVRFLWLVPPRQWSRPLFAPAAVAAVVIILHMLDNVLNAMPNPAYMLMAAGLGGLAGVRVPQTGVVEPQAAQSEVATPRDAVLPRPDPGRPGVLRRPRPVCG